MPVQLLSLGCSCGNKIVMAVRSRPFPVLCEGIPDKPEIGPAHTFECDKCHRSLTIPYEPWRALRSNEETNLICPGCGGSSSYYLYEAYNGKHVFFCFKCGKYPTLSKEEYEEVRPAK